MATKIANGQRVQIEYELRVAGGAIIESSDGRGPLTYVHGAGRMLPGLERRMEGLVAGQSLQGILPAAEAFGTEESLPKVTLPRSHFPKDATLAAGAVFEATGNDGKPVSFQIVSLGRDDVVVRLMHPLAGKDVVYRVKVLAVTDGKAPPLPPGLLEAELVELEDDA